MTTCAAFIDGIILICVLMLGFLAIVIPLFIIMYALYRHWGGKKSFFQYIDML